MSNLVINTGSSPNDGTGDSLLVGATKINSNFSEIYGALGPGTNLSVGFGKTVISIQSGSLNVGIGTSAVGAKLHVRSNTTGIAGLFSGTTSGDMVRITQLGTGNALVVEDSANPDSTPFIINNAGTVLVGTTTVTGTANQILQVAGGAYVFGNVGIGTSRPTVTLQLSQNANISNVGTAITLSGTVGVALTVAQFYHGNGNNSYLRIKATRNDVGTDWTSASTKLVNVTDVTEQGYIEYNPNGSLYGMAFGSGATEWARFLQYGNFLVGTATSTGTATQTLQVIGGAYVSAGAGSSVGIGTTNPARKVHIWGDGTLSPYEINLSLNSTNSSGFGPYFGLNGSSLSGGRNWHVSSGGNLDLAGVGKFSISDITANASRLVIDSVGNVGIGTTIPTSRLWVNDNAFFTGIITATSTVVGSAVTISSGGINVTGIVTAITVVTQPGTATTVPLLFNAGTITTPNATPGGVEYDGQSFYATGVSTSGRGLVPVQQSYRLNANRGVIVAGLAYTNYFDPATLPLASAGAHEVEFELYFNKGTIGITTFTISTPSATSNINAILTTSPQAGLTTNSTGAVTTVFPQMIGIVGTALTSVGLGLTLPSGNNYAKLSVFVENAAVTNNSLTLNVTNTNSTFQPLRGSRFKSTLLARTVSIGITG